MAKELICPHCKKGISPVGGFDFDETLNMVCGNCRGVVFATSKATEDKIKHTLVNTHHVGWQKRDCLPIKMNALASSNNLLPTAQAQYGYEVVD